MKKRGQLLGQPFVMVFALIVGALILTWGIYEVYKLLAVAKDVEVNDYISTLGKDVDRYYYLEPGSSNRFRVSLPSDFSHICFVSREPSATLDSNPVPKPNNYNHNFVLARKGDNVFVYSAKDVSAFYVPYVRPPSSSNPSCFANNAFLTLTSKGTYVEVS